MFVLSILCYVDLQSQSFENLSQKEKYYRERNLHLWLDPNSQPSALYRYQSDEIIVAAILVINNNLKSKKEYDMFEDERETFEDHFPQDEYRPEAQALYQHILSQLK